MEFVLRNTKSNIKLLNELGIGFFTFNERYEMFRKANSKRKAGLTTPEIFSLNYDTLLSDLKQSIFVNCESLPDSIQIIEKL